MSFDPTLLPQNIRDDLAAAVSDESILAADQVTDATNQAALVDATTTAKASADKVTPISRRS